MDYSNDPLCRTSKPKRPFIGDDCSKLAQDHIPESKSPTSISNAESFLRKDSLDRNRNGPREEQGILDAKVEVDSSFDSRKMEDIASELDRSGEDVDYSVTKETIMRTSTFDRVAPQESEDTDEIASADMQVPSEL